MNDTLNAIAFGSITLIGTGEIKDRPLKHGNCFDLHTEDGKYYRILNFVYENLDYAIEHNLITWPIKILPISKRYAVIHDSRIPNNWYCLEFCRVCTPVDLLPFPQQLERTREIESGIRIIKEGFEQYNMLKVPKWSLENQQNTYENWTVEYQNDFVATSGIDTEDRLANILKEEIETSNDKKDK